MGRREEAKEERRQRIVCAARELIRETGDAGLSMRALARRAGVSLTTPYNLFGSKRAIILGTLQDAAVFREGLDKYRHQGPLERIFGTLTVAAKMYAADQRFYLPLFQALFDIRGGAEYRTFFGPSRHAFWRTLVVEAMQAELIDPDLNVDLFTSALEQSILSSLLQWTLGDIGPQHLEPGLHYGFAIVLGGVATDKSRDVLKARREAAEARLLQLFPMDAVGVTAAE